MVRIFFIGFVKEEDFWFARLSKLDKLDSGEEKIKHEFERSRVAIFETFFSFKEFEEPFFVNFPVQPNTGRQKVLFLAFWFVNSASEMRLWREGEFRYKSKISCSVATSSVSIESEAMCPWLVALTSIIFNFFLIFALLSSFPIL